MIHLGFPEVTVAARVFIGLVFFTAAAGKFRHWAVFHGVVANYRLLPPFLVAPAAYLLPPVEALLGLALLSGLGFPWPEITAAALLSIFALGMGVNIGRGRHSIDCGCFQSALKQTLSWTLVGRNMFMVCFLGLAVMSAGRVANIRESVDGVLVGAVLWILLQSLNLLWSIVPAWGQSARMGGGRAL